jgi:hypothetical protein
VIDAAMPLSSLGLPVMPDHFPIIFIYGTDTGQLCLW